MLFTIADHHREPTRFPICGQGHVWKQRGNTTGHCASCHATIDGQRLFDKHQTTDDRGRTVCRPLEALLQEDPDLRIIDGALRGRAMTEEESARARGER